MMETMIPPQVGMRLRMKINNKKREAKEAQVKKEKRGHKKDKAQIKKVKKREKKREGAMLLSFYHTCASK